jgi:hypothetical protein
MVCEHYRVWIERQGEFAEMREGAQRILAMNVHRAFLMRLGAGKDDRIPQFSPNESLSLAQVRPSATTSGHFGRSQLNIVSTA